MRSGGHAFPVNIRNLAYNHVISCNLSKLYIYNIMDRNKRGWFQPLKPFSGSATAIFRKLPKCHDKPM